MVIPFAFLSPTTMIVVVIVALLVFGPHKMPELMRQLGQALREFKKMSGDVQGVFNLDDHLSYDRYEPPSYTYSPPVTSYEPLDQYHDEYSEPEHPALEAAPVVEEEEKPKRKRAPRKKADAEAVVEEMPSEGEAAPPKPRRKRTPKTVVEAEAGTIPEAPDVKETETPQG